MVNPLDKLDPRVAVPITAFRRQRCGSGVGASVAANKAAGIRACLIYETSSAHRGVQDDDLNMICLGSLVAGHALAGELVNTFLAAQFSGAERHRRRLAKVAELEGRETPS